ncbi:MAG TPA: UDP-N-acetylmuramoyl-L-alanine--D-glutamate ligase [Actinomycetota bacterium]|jgi:UDP-N-acetylmuramoylalanine--D-glutamate ligase
MTGAFDGLRAVVIGFGVSGRAAASALSDEGAAVTVTESRPVEAVVAGGAGVGDSAARLGDVPPNIRLHAGGHRPEHLDGADVVVVSPGVPENAPVLQWAQERGLPIWSELEVGARLCTVPFVAVTGTNGKTTTVELIAAMMRASGLSAVACGNVGHPFSLAAREAHDALAVEASSFQLRFQETLHPRVSVLLNLAPDHLDWHGSFEAYAAAKARIFARQSAPDVHVGNRDDIEGSRVSAKAPCDVRWFRWGAPQEGETGATPGGVLSAMQPTNRPETNGGELGDGTFVGRPTSLSPAFVMDAAAAAAAGLSFGLPIEAVRHAIESFTPLPHRGSVVAELGAVRFVNDSKATNPHAALAALQGLDNVVLIAGGLAKGIDLSPLAQAAPHLAAVIAIGASAPEIARIFDGLVSVDIATTMEEAVRMAFERAPSNGTVLLAPACASQDMFRDYRERGERFAQAAASLAGSDRPLSAASLPRGKERHGD